MDSVETACFGVEKKTKNTFLHLTISLCVTLRPETFWLTISYFIDFPSTICLIAKIHLAVILSKFSS